MTGTWLLFIHSLSLGFGWRSFAVAGASVLFLAAFFYEPKVFKKIRSEAGKIANNAGKKYKFLLLIAAVAALFAFLFNSHLLEPKADGTYSGGSTWGDLALHLSLINNFLASPNILLEYPVFAGQRLAYPFLTDFFTASLAFQSDLRLALLVSSIVFSICFVALAYFFAKQFGGSERGARIAVLLLLFAGGLGTYYLLASGQGVEAAVQNHSHSFLGDKYNIHFTNFLTDYWLPQRNNLIAFCAMLVVLSLLWRNRAAKERRPGELLFAGLVLGMTPLFSFHVFVSTLAAVVFSGLFFLDWKNLKLDWKNWKSFKLLENDLKKIAWFLVPATLMAVPQIMWSLPQAAGAAGSIWFRPGWMTGSEGIAAFLLNNFGLLLPLAIISFFKSSPDQKKFYAGFAALFLAANLFIFQPWDYDNIKFFFSWLVPTAALVGGFLGKVYDQGNLKKMLAIGLAILICLPGFFFVSREAELSWKLYSNEDVAFAEWVNASTPADAIFLTADDHNHPVQSLAGRRVVLGYKGWLWSHGLDYSQREKDVLQMFGGGPEARQLLEKYNVSFVAVGASERTKLGANRQFFENNFEKVYDGNGYEVFRASK